MSNQNLPSKKIPLYTDLVIPDQLTKDANEFQVLINQEPREAWLKTNKYANSSKYIPIGIVEWLMTSIFPDWYLEVIEHKQICNSITAHVRLFFFHPIYKEWRHMDGVGAAPLQTNEGASPMDASAIKPGAVQIALPIAESFAFKDAAEKLGKIFGKDLNRKESMGYENLSGRFDKKEDHQTKRIILLIDKAQSRGELEKLRPHITEDSKKVFENKLATLK